MFVMLFYVCVIHSIFSKYTIASVPSYQIGNREELVIDNVTSYDQFKLGQDVLKWESISLREKNYAVGLIRNGVSIVVAERNDTEIISSEKVTDFNGTVSDLKIFKIWNVSGRKYDIVIAVIVEKTNYELEWYKILEKNDLELIWTWHLHKYVLHMNIFKMEKRNVLLTINLNEERRSTVDMYEFSFTDGHNEFWLIQTIPLDSPAKHSALNNYGPHYFLSIPQNSSLSVFKYTGDHFKTFRNYSTQHNSFVSSFNLGYKSFIVTDGYNAGIYQFTKNGIVRQNVEQGNFDMITFWLPISITTYRDEIILLAQRTLDHRTHKSFAIEVILYRGENFVVHEEMSCTYYGELSSGINCIVEEDNNENGIFGSAVLFFGTYFGVLTPKNNSSSSLFIVKTRMKQMPNPMQIHIEQLKEKRKNLQKMIDERKVSLQMIDKRIQNSVQLDSANNFTAPWKIKKLIAPANDTIDTLDGNSTERLSSDGTNLEYFSQHVDKIKEQIKNIKTHLNDVVSLKDDEIKLEKLTVNGFVEVLGKSMIHSVSTKNFNDRSTNDVFNEYAKLNDLKSIMSEKTFTNIKVDNLHFESVNGVNSSELIFQNNSKPVTIKGVLMFKNPVTILQDLNITTGNVNDVNLKEEIIEIGKTYQDHLTFEDLKIQDTLVVKIANKFPIHSNYLDAFVDDDSSNEDMVFDSLYLPGNVTVENVNGVNFNKFLERLCLRNIKTYIPGDTIITKNVKISGNLDINYLNNLIFPDQYVFGNTNTTKIYGNKIFNGLLTTNEFTTEGLINGIKTNTIVSLSKNETITGKVTFADLEITERLDVDGNVTGANVEDFLPNLTVKDTNVLNSNINFNTLEVDGDITIASRFNGSDIRLLFENVVFKNEESVIINATKEFPKGLTSKHINILSNSINDIQLEKIIDKNSEQEISLRILNGDVTFKNVHLQGLFDNMNVTKLYQESPKLNEDQHIFGSLTFENEIFVEYLEIIDELNELKPDEYIYIDGDRHFIMLSSLDNVTADSVTVEGSFKGELTNFDLEDFDNRRLSLTKDQFITAEYFLKNSTITEIEVQNINDNAYSDLFGLERFIDIISEMFNDNKLKVKNMIVNGNLTIEYLNNMKMEDILKNCVYKDEKLNPNIAFADIVNFKSIQIEEFNGVNFDEFASNLIYKNETSLTINGQKLFIGGIKVNNFIETNYINDIALKNVLRKTDAQTIAGPLTIFGDVVIHSDAQILGSLNDVPVKNITDVFDVVNDTYVINGDIFFEKMAYIKNAFVNGFVNGNNLTEFFEQVVHLHDDVKIPGVTTFMNSVNVTGNLAITDDLNGINLSRLKHEIILTTQDSFIEGSVTFQKPVKIKNELNLDYHLLSRYVMGVDLQNWIENATYINKGMIPGALSFKSVTIHDNVRTSYINNVNMSTLIPLRTEQNIEQSFYIEELAAFNDIVVDNLINGIKIEPLYDNTVMIDSEQHITSQIVFNDNIIVRDSLRLNYVNDLDFNKIVTTYTDQNLSAVYEFDEEITMNSNLSIYGLINGVNLTDWEENALKFTNYSQNITSDWIVKKNLTFENNVGGDVLISGLDVTKMADIVEAKRQFKTVVENELVEDYSAVCSDVDYFLRAAKSQLYRFKYFDYIQFLNFNANIENIHHFSYQGVNYLLTNEENSCEASLFAWSNSQFTLISQIETGLVSQFITVQEEENLYIVGTSRCLTTSCKIEGTNIWMFDDSNLLLHVDKIEDQDLLQDSLIPGTFYGLGKEHVIEFKIKSNQEKPTKKYRKWKINGTNVSFIPRGLNTGLALRNGRKIYKLHQDELSIELDFGYETEDIIIGTVTEEDNIFLPGRNMGDVVVLNTGMPRKRKLVAVAVHEETSVKGSFDFIKIYDDIMEGKLYHKVSTYNPSSLISLEFGENGETFLVFLEDERTLQIYEYKGVEGFKLRSFAKMNGQKLLLMRLPTNTQQNLRSVIAVIDKNRLSLVGAVMDGHEINVENVKCEL